jgi:uncharacterized protein YehS (DUF1456 family)
MIGFSRGCLAQILNARGRRNFRHAADKFIRQYSRAHVTALSAENAQDAVQNLH